MTPSRPPAPPRQAKTGFDQIEDVVDRAEARKAFDRMKRHDPGLTEAEYLTVLLDPHADVLAVRRAARKA